MKIFDTHAHYTSSQFDANRTELLQSLPSQKIGGVVDCATDHASAQQSLALAEQYPFFWVAAGIHPESLIEEAASTQTVYKGDWQAELAAIEPLLSHPRVVAVGECGLDYHWPVPKDAQQQLFVAQLRMAQEHDLPILVHDREAHADTYTLLRKYAPKGIVHCYSGSADDAAWLTRQGLLLGIGGVVTFANAHKLHEVVRQTPLEHMVLETDCPYLAPVPFRGKQCHSGLLIHVAEKIAALKGTDAQTVVRITTENAERLLNVKAL